MLPNAQAQSCGNGPAISFTFWCIPASIISSSNINSVFPRVRRWPDPPHSLSNRFHSLSPSRTICTLLHSHPNLLQTFFDLSLPVLLWPSLLSLSIHLKHHCLLQNALLIPPNHMSIPSYSIRLCHFI